MRDGGGDPLGWDTPEWTLESDQTLCRLIGVNTAILSPTAPGPEIKENFVEGAELARRMNDFCARIRNEDSSHYGFFATVPSPLDVESCIAEIDRAFDTLHADGVVLLTRYGKGNHYLGHPEFQWVWKELNRRKAVVFIHPTHAVDTEAVDAQLPQPMLDYPHETGRTAVDLILSNTLSEAARDCKIILSHGGGTLPMLIARVEGLLPFSGLGEKSMQQIREEAGWFYFDTALSSSDEQLAALIKVAKKGHILFGSDHPNAPVESIEHFTNTLQESKILDEAALEDIHYRAALDLFPRLAEKR